MNTKKRVRMLEKKNHRLLTCIVTVTLLYLAGCGSEEDRQNIGERLSGPEANSALPMRIDETPTPTPTITPQNPASHQTDAADQGHAESSAPGDPSDNETATPPPDMTPTESLSDPESNLASHQSESQTVPSPTPTPVPTPTPAPSPTPAPKKISASTQKTLDVSDSGKDEEKARSKEVTIPKEKETQPPQVKKDVQKKTSSSSQSIILNQAEICSKISNRQPSGSAETFSFAQVKKIYTWMKVSGVKPPTTVKHIYYRNGNLIATVKLKLKYASMRTWSQKTFKAGEAVGEWKVVITTDNEENALAVKEFTVTP